MRHNEKGFTLVELLVVIVIISLLAGWASLEIYKRLGTAKRDIARAKIEVVEGAIVRFSIDCDRMPDDSEQLEVLLVEPDELEGKWKGPYLKRSALLDPWGNPFVYTEEGEINVGSFDLISYGKDGQEGGEDDAEDIYND